MWPLISVFVDIALHRRGPQHLPASQFLVGLLFVVDFAVGLASLRVDGSVSGRSALFLVADALAYLGYVWVVLNIFSRQRRFKQTASALLGTDVLLNVLGIPLLVWDNAVNAGKSDLTLPALLYIGLFFWSLDIGGYIVSRALDRPYIVGVLIVVMYVMTSMIIRSDVLGSVGG